MSLMLASVNSLEEAKLVKQINVDIIDLKQPALGALGALPVETVAEIVAALKPSARISATVGDLPMQPDLLRDAVKTMSDTGVDYVKIGFFPTGNWRDCIDALAGCARRHALIAVLFADTRPDFAVIKTLAESGFQGVMLDTMDKRRGSLTELMAVGELQRFVLAAKACSLLSGLAGSLKAGDIAQLLPLDADYLGFRGALCRESNRTAALDARQVLDIKALLKSESVLGKVQVTKQRASLLT